MITRERFQRKKKLKKDSKKAGRIGAYSCEVGNVDPIEEFLTNFSMPNFLSVSVPTNLETMHAI